jgi:hypothetical protein
MHERHEREDSFDLNSEENKTKVPSHKPQPYPLKTSADLLEMLGMENWTRIMESPPRDHTDKDSQCLLPLSPDALLMPKPA